MKIKIIREKGLLRRAFNKWKNNVDIENAIQKLRTKLMFFIYDKNRNINENNALQKYFNRWKNINKVEKIKTDINILKQTQNKTKVVTIKTIIKNKNKNKQKDILKKYLNKWINVLKSEKPLLREFFKKITKINIYKNGPEFLDRLNNVGEICYMNSILQCFNHTKALTNYLLSQSNQIYNNTKIEFSKIYLELIENLWNIKQHSLDNNMLLPPNKAFEPYHFRNEVICRNKAFQNSGPDEIEKFVEFFLNVLHKELYLINKSSDYIIENIDDSYLNQNDKKKIFQIIHDYYNQEKSIISDLFFGFNEIFSILK